MSAFRDSGYRDGAKNRVSPVPNEERLILSHPVPGDVVARMVVYLLVQMLALLLAQLVVLIGLTAGVFERCFFNRSRH